jgi:hypothetical protein
MKKGFLAFLAGFWMCVFALAADAQSIDCQKLDLTSMTPQQIETAKQFCQQAAPIAAAAAASKNITPDKVREWASIGKDFSTAIVETAKGLGQTANEFLFTPVGIMIAFYFMWGKIGGIIVGVPLMFASWWLYSVICRRITTTQIEYTQAPVLWGLFTVRKVAKVEYQNDSDNQWTWAGLAIPLLIINAMILGFLIF